MFFKKKKQRLEYEKRIEEVPKIELEFPKFKYY